MSKVVRVDECLDCPFVLPTFGSGECAAYCKQKAGKAILSLETIPEWCPLEKEKERRRVMMKSEEQIREKISFLKKAKAEFIKRSILGFPVNVAVHLFDTMITALEWVISDEKEKSSDT